MVAGAWLLTRLSLWYWTTLRSSDSIQLTNNYKTIALINMDPLDMANRIVQLEQALAASSAAATADPAGVDVVQHSNVNDQDTQLHRRLQEAEKKLNSVAA